MNMLLWTTDVTEEHYPLFAELRETGFDGVEIMMGERDVAHYEAIGRELDRQDLQRTAVGALDAEHNPVSPDAGTRAAALRRLAAMAEKAAAMGADRLVGPFHSAYKVFTGAPPTTDELSWCAETLGRAAADAGERGVTIAVEPLNRFECYVMNTAAQGAEMVRRVAHPNLVMLYDTHHMHIEEKDVSAAIRASAGTIGHVHVSECDRGTPGKGQVDWPGTFAALRAIDYRGWLVIEAFSRLDPAFAGMIHIWRDFFASPEEVYRDGHAFIRRAWREA